MLVAWLHGQPLQQWVHANASKAVFAATRSRIAKERNAAIILPVLNPKTVARRELLNAHRYQLHVRVVNVQKSWWQKLLDGIWDTWKQLLRRLFAKAKLNPAVALSVGDIVIAGVVLIVLGITLRLLLRLRGEAISKDSVHTLQAQRDARDLFARACQAAARGERDIAAQLAFLSVIVAFDLHGILRENQSATVGEMRNALAHKHSELLPLYDRVARTFTMAAYAQTRVNEIDWNDSRTACGQLLEATSA